MATAQLGTVLRHIQLLTADQKTHQQSDGELLGGFLSRNDQAAFEVLVRRHGPMVLRLCRRWLGNMDDAEDVFQATFLVLARQAASIRKKESLASWLHGVAYRMATNARRAAARRRQHEQQASPIRPTDPAYSAVSQEIQAALDEEIHGLPQTYREPFVLCCLEHRSVAEAANRLGLNEAAVRNRLTRARKLLRQRLAGRGVSLTAVLAVIALSGTSALASLPRSLVGSTVNAAVNLATGNALASGLVSAKVVALVEGVNQAMFLTKAKIATAILLALSIVAAGTGVITQRTLAAKQAKTQAGEPPKARATGPERATSKDANKSSPETAKGDKEERVEVGGQVLDPEGKPFAGAKLYLASHTLKGRQVEERATSRKDGRFSFTCAKSELAKPSEDAPPSQTIAVAKGYGCDWALVGEAETERELTLRLVKDVPISGRILDPDGKPVVGAKLTVTGVSAPKGDDLRDYVEAIRKDVGYAFAKDWHGPLPERPAVLTTGVDGRFKLIGAGRERVVYFRIEGPGIATVGLHAMTRTSEKVTSDNGYQRTYGASFDYVGFASRPIRGVVRDKETGKPLAGASVERWGCKALTDKEGRYLLLGLAKEQHYSLEVKPADGLHFEREVRLEDAGGLGALTGDIEMLQGLTVRGRVTDKATGKPIAQARVDYHPLSPNPNVNAKLAGSWSPRAEATTGPDGSYALTVLPGPGVIGVTGPKPDAYMPALVTRKELKDFFKTPILTTNERQAEDYLTTDAGNHSHSSIGQASYHALVLLDPGEKETALVKNVALERPITLKGRVVGPDDQPLTGVTVFGLAPHGFETLKGAEFIVRGVNPRRVNRQLVFYHKDKNMGFYLKELRGDTSGPLTIKLQPCGSASGRMVDRDGQPLAGLRIHLSGFGVLGFAGAQAVTTDKEGIFRAEGLVPGLEYWIFQLRAASYGLATLLVESGKHKDVGDVKARLDK